MFNTNQRIIEEKEMESTVVDVLARRFAYLADAAPVLEELLVPDTKEMTTCAGFQFELDDLRFKFYFHEGSEATVEAYWANIPICKHRSGETFTVFEKQDINEEAVHTLITETHWLIDLLLQTEN